MDDNQYQCILHMLQMPKVWGFCRNQYICMQELVAIITNFICHQSACSKCLACFFKAIISSINTKPRIQNVSRSTPDGYLILTLGGLQSDLDSLTANKTAGKILQGTCSMLLGNWCPIDRSNQGFLYKKNNFDNQIEFLTKLQLKNCPY